MMGSEEGRGRAGVQDCPVHGTLPPEDDGDRTEQMGAIRFAGHHQARNIWGPPAPETRWDYIARTGIPESLAYVAELLAAPLPRVKALTALATSWPASSSPSAAPASGSASSAHAR